MGLGIVSIVGYLIFLIWVVATAPAGHQEIPAFGEGEVDFAAAMGSAFAIQGFFIPVLKRNKNPAKYIHFTLISYILGGIAYYYIAYMGAFGTQFMMQEF